MWKTDNGCGAQRYGFSFDTPFRYLTEPAVMVPVGCAADAAVLEKKCKPLEDILLELPVFFADSYCAWQKGGIENGNKLIRQCIPKRTGVSTVTDGEIAKIRKKINARPRERFNFMTLAECFFKNIS